MATVTRNVGGSIPVAAAAVRTRRRRRERETNEKVWGEPGV